MENYMNQLTIEYTSKEAHKAILEANLRMEQVEVLLNNLLALKHPIKDKFIIPFDDVLVSLKTAIKLLNPPY